MSPLVSVIMPAWRPRADWLLEAVRSVLQDRSCALELLVVDDGSEQPVQDLLAAVDDPRLHVIRVPRCGPYAARAAASPASRGEFVRFFDADDVAEPGSTGRLLELAVDGGEALAYGATLMCDAALRPQRTATSDLEGMVAESCLIGGFDVFVVSLLFPRSVVDRAGPWEAGFAVSGDWDFVLRALEQAPVRRLDDVVTRYRRHAASVTKQADVAAGTIAGEMVLGRYFARHPEQRRTPLERRAYVRLYLDRALAHEWLGEHALAARQLARAARLDPAAALGTVVRWSCSRLRGFVARARKRPPAPARRQS